VCERRSNLINPETAVLGREIATSQSTLLAMTPPVCEQRAACASGEAISSGLWDASACGRPTAPAYRRFDGRRARGYNAPMSGERVLIVEDERAVARGLEYGLTKEGYTVLWAESGQKALQLAHSENPDLVLLDIRLPDISGFDVCRQLRSEGQRCPILMLTARDEEVDKVLGLELGADDYVVKPYSLRELISRVRALLRRAYGDLAVPQEKERLTFGDLEIDLERLSVRRGGVLVDLTPIEFRLLRYLAAHADRPFSRAALIEAIWGYDSSVGNDRTVDVHMRHLREKLEDNPSNPRWLLTVRGIGYKLAP
jgi:two-component system alkaline phosphatase synthesis response regulator PhoP